MRMINHAKLHNDNPTLFYADAVRALLFACEHYLDKVTRVQTPDVHERARHKAGLSGQIERCEKWLGSGHADKVEAWKKVRLLEANTAYFIGAAAIWLQEMARGA